MPSTQHDPDYAALKAFEAAPGLSKLEDLITPFNIFEAVGVIRQEVRHSDFLATLLDPHRAGYLGITFLQRLLKALAPSTARWEKPITEGELDRCELERVVVRREWKHIDILLLVDIRLPQGVRRLAVIIENKVDSGERADQLAAYYHAVRRHHPDREIIGVYLTPAGYAPTEKSVPYTSLTYATIHDILEEIARRDGPTDDVAAAVRHYTALLRRHIVSKSDVATLCRELYGKHRRAIDLILAHQPKRFDEISAVFSRLIQEDGERFSLTRHTPWFTHFSAQAWKDIGPLQVETAGRRILVFCLDPDGYRVSLSLQVGPGDESVRERLIQAALDHPDILCKPIPTLSPAYQKIYDRVLLSSWSGESTREELYAEIKEPWEQFLTGDYPKIVDLIAAQDWSL